MLEAMNLLQIYRGFEGTRNRIAWLALTSVWGFDSALKPTKNVAISFKFLPKICCEGLFDAREVKSKEIGAR